jgi:hypothetical protein
VHKVFRVLQVLSEQLEQVSRELPVPQAYREFRVMLVPLVHRVFKEMQV